MSIYAASRISQRQPIESADLHSIFEPVGLDRGGGPKTRWSHVSSFKGDKELALDATCTYSLSASILYTTILNPGSASSAAEALKSLKYSQLVADIVFVPVAVETSCITGFAGCCLLTDVVRCISWATNNPSQTSYIFQQISVTIIRGNALAITSLLRRYAEI